MPGSGRQRSDAHSGGVRVQGNIQVHLAPDEVFDPSLTVSKQQLFRDFLKILNSIKNRVTNGKRLTSFWDKDFGCDPVMVTSEVLMSSRDIMDVLDGLTDGLVFDNWFSFSIISFRNFFRKELNKIWFKSLGNHSQYNRWHRSRQRQDWSYGMRCVPCRRRPSICCAYRASHSLEIYISPISGRAIDSNVIIVQLEVKCRSVCFL